MSPNKPAAGLFGNASTGPTTGGTLFNFAGTGTSSGLFNSNFKFGAASTTSSSASVFGQNSLFGGNTALPATSPFANNTGSGLFGNSGTTGGLFGSGIPATGGSLFNSNTNLFLGQNNMFANSSKTKEEGSGEEDGDDENVGNGSNSPPSFMP